LSIDNLFSKTFDDEIRDAFKILMERRLTQAERLNKDLQRLDSLLTTFEPFPPNHMFDRDFLAAAVDGSGISSLCVFEDNFIQLVTAAIAIHDTNTRENKPMKYIDLNGIIQNNGILTKVFTFSADRELFVQQYMDFYKSIYPMPELIEPILSHMEDYSQWDPEIFHIFNKQDLIKRIRSSLHDYILFPSPLREENILQSVREIVEYSLAKQAILCDLPIKYLILDGSLTIFSPEKQKVPLGDYLLRDLCLNARKRNIILCGLSKTHTIPGATQISEIAKEQFGSNEHWFCRIPGREDDQGKFSIYENREIPPAMAITYLFKFSERSPTFRIDFDYFWWMKHIFDKDTEIMKHNESTLFKELDFMSHEANWYGYPCPPGFAHKKCTISQIVREILASRAIQIAKELGMSEEHLTPARKKIGL
jgi:hypothetical protein